MLVWCVEDDESIREIELYTLKSVGFDAEGFGNGKDFFQALKHQKPDLVLLDIMLPDEDGTEILDEIRKHPDTEDLPVIMASAKGAEYDKVKSLDNGADDYLAKPFGMMEMVSRINAVLRRYGKKKTSVISHDGIVIDTAKHQVTVDNQEIDLTLKEYELLKLLMSHPGIVYDREQILDRIWGMDYDGETRTVDVHIRTLRSKLGNKESHIDTVRGVGYRYQEG